MSCPTVKDSSGADFVTTVDETGGLVELGRPFGGEEL